jgi:hypothetical protein
MDSNEFEGLVALLAVMNRDGLEGLVALLAVVLVVGVLVAILIRYGAKQAKLQQAIWEEAARRVGGTYFPIGGPWYNRKPAYIQAQIDGIPLTLDSYVVSNGKSSTTYTRVRAAAPNAERVELDLGKEGFFSSVAKSLGAQDIEVGDELFDKTFVVKSNDGELAKAWLHEEARALLQAATSYSYSLRKGELKAVRVGYDANLESLEAVMRASAALASGGLRIAQRWQQLATSLGGSLLPSKNAANDYLPSIEFELRGVHITLSAPREFSGWIFQSAQLYTQLTARLLGERQPFALHMGEAPKQAETLPEATPDRSLGVHYRLRSADAERTNAELSGAVAARLLRGLPELVYGDDKQVHAVCRGLVTNAERLSSVVEALVEFCVANHAGPYR